MVKLQQCSLDTHLINLIEQTTCHPPLDGGAVGVWAQQPADRFCMKDACTHGLSLIAKNEKKKTERKMQDSYGRMHDLGWGGGGREISLN